jgi:phospholipase C
MSIHRRDFVKTVTGAGMLGACGSAGRSARGQSISRSASIRAGIPELVNGSVALTGSVILPPPGESGIEHIVVVTMENRSFDHFLGWLPGADGKQAGLSYLDNSGVTHSTSELAPDFIGCGHPDPDHSYDQSRVAYDNGQMDGFLRAGSNDVFSIGYYSQPDLPFYNTLAQEYLVCDRYFASILGPTFSNRMFLWAAQTDRLDDSVSLTKLPTIFDRLLAAGVSHRYYFNNLPYLLLWGLKYLLWTSPFSQFLTQAAAGTLPAVSFVDPNYTIIDNGKGNDDHPHADVRNGDAFLSQVFQAVSSGPAWRKTVLIITFDEWGGFFEHVPPPRVAAANNLDQDQVNGQVLLGMRVPTVIASPFTRNTGPSPLVNHTVFDHTSILKLIEWRWGLQPLTPRDASPQIGNPATAMNFTSPNSGLPGLPSPSTVYAPPCYEGGILDSSSAKPSFAKASGRNNAWTSLAASRLAREWLAGANRR